MKTINSASAAAQPTPGSNIVTFPLTREQEGLWIEWKLSPIGVSYNTCIQMKLEGPLDPARYSQSIADVVELFELLRGYCVEQDDQPYFCLSDEEYQIEYIDLADGNKPETPALHNKAMGLLTRRRDAAIDLTQFPLIRSALVRTAVETYYFVGVVPHIISDGYSAVFILKAISIAYNEGKQGLINAFGEERKDWRDYLDRRAEQTEESRQLAAEHWQQVLAGAQHITPICGPAPEDAGGVVDIEGRRHFFSLSADQVQRFARLARSRKTSLFSILAALYASLLYRQTNQEDLVVVFPVDLRPAGFRDAFGFFVNMMPLRVDMSGNPSFVELLDQIGKRRRTDKKHQHLPGLDIIKAKRESTPGFDGRLCNVSMAQTVSRFQGVDIPGVTATALDNDQIHVRDDLSLMYEVSEELIGLWLEYRESTFADGEIERMADHFLRIADAVDKDPDTRIADIELLSSEQNAALLALGRGPEQVVEEASYGELFSQSAARHADQVALRYHDQKMTYAELEAASGKLAVQLQQSLGRVALVLPRSPAQIIAMLAALRAGVAYVPLDPDQPIARIDTILAELNPSHLICAPELLEALAADWKSVYVAAEFAAEPISYELNPVVGTNAAYAIYTSGSTGRPKGVQVSHHALVNRIAWLTSEFSLVPGEPVLQNTNYAFDVSVGEIFWPLAMGATLVLSDPKLARDPRYLRQLIADEQVTTACMVASGLQMLLPDAAERHMLDSLTRLLCAGEALSLGLTQQFYRSTQARLFNIYGPTEATIYSTWKEIDVKDAFISIGKPIANTSVAVINDAMHIQPQGIEGELCLSGEGLADGYIDQPELTAEKFPLAIIDGQRWYRTGDRARLLKDGEVEYLGRADGQIKLRGYRIELGEIEHAMRVQPQIQDAAVIVRTAETADATKSLAAFVAAGADFEQIAHDEAHPLHANNWRATLTASLPSYMVPNTLNWVATIPRLASGKLDRNGLPAVVAGQAKVRVPPSSADEITLAKIWATVLGLPQQEIGIHSNFFELGGDSLMLIALATKAEDAGLFIDVHELFEHATIATALPLARKEPRQLINQAPVQGKFNALPRHYKFFADNFEYPNHWNRSFVLRFNRHIDAAALAQSLEAAVRHHDGLRSSFHKTNNSVVLTNHSATEAVPGIETFDLIEIDPAERHAWMLAQMNAANASLQLDKPLLLRVLLFEDERTSTIGLIMHHLLIDMRSCQILLEDLLSGYQASVSHRPIRLPAKTTSIAEWSERLTKLVDQDWQADEVAFWQEQLSHVGHPIPSDHPATERTPTEADQRLIELDLSARQTDLLTRELPLELGMGVQEILLASFARVFKDWSASSHLVVNTCGIGRDNLIEGVNLTRTVGELNTVFPVAIDLQNDDLLDTVKDRYQGLPAGGLHYGMLRYFGKHENLDMPEPDIFFNYVSRLDTSAEKALGVSVEMAPAGVNSSNPNNRACYALYLEALIQGGCLSLHLGYDSGRFSDSTMQTVLQHWADALVDLL